MPLISASDGQIMDLMMVQSSCINQLMVIFTDFSSDRLVGFAFSIFRSEDIIKSFSLSGTCDN